MCQVRIGAYVSLLTPGETDYTACHPGKTTTYILHVVSITTHTHDRRKSIGEKKKKKRREDKGKDRKEKKANQEKKGKERREKTRKEKQEKTRQEEEERKGRENCHSSRP